MNNNISAEETKLGWYQHKVMIHHGATDTHKGTKRPYETMTLAEVLGRATLEEIRTLAAAVGDRLDSRIAAMRRAAREVRSQWAVLSALNDTQTLSEVRLILRGAA